MPRNPFKRSVTVPADVVAAAPLAPGEKVLAGTRTTDGAWLLGTRQALYVVPAASAIDGATDGATDGAAPSRTPWERVERADWDRDEERLVVTEVGEFGRVRPQQVFSVSEPGVLLELVRERVSASVVLQRRVLTEGKKGLLVIGRRSPVGHGEVFWAYDFDPGVDPEDPSVMALAEAGLRAAQDDLGL
jgi:hypothetical protein